MCALDGAYTGSANRCVQSSGEKGAAGNKIPFGESSAQDTSEYDGMPLLHYVITARISGPRGASVTNQMIVLIGA
jgi:hypothetical protein